MAYIRMMLMMPHRYYPPYVAMDIPWCHHPMQFGYLRKIDGQEQFC